MGRGLGSSPNYGAIDSPVVGLRHWRRVKLVVAGSLLGVVAAAVILSVPGVRRENTTLEQLPSSWRLGLPWEADYGFEPLDESSHPEPFNEGVYEDSTPGYDANNCITNPFSELPEGFLCSSVKFGAYLLDPYGSLYNRRIQWNTRHVVDHMIGEENEAVVANDAPPLKRAEPAAPSWHSSWTWVRPALLPNTTECQQAIEGYYFAISSPNNENLTLATSYMATDFVYQGPQSPLLPACVPAIGSGRQVKGADAWADAFDEQLLAFGSSNSSLGAVHCKSVNTKKALTPLIKCVAKHECVFELKSLKNITGGNVTIMGDIMDTFYFDRDTKIVWMSSDLEAVDFHTLKDSQEETPGAEAAE